VPIIDSMDINVEHNHTHSRNSVKQDRVLKVGNVKYKYATKFGSIITNVDG